MVRKLTDPNLDEGDRTMLRHIAEHRWSVTNIFPEENCPGWSFTTGLFSELSVPEIIVFGLPQSVAHYVLNEIGGRFQAGDEVDEDVPLSGLLEGVDCLLREVRTHWYSAFVGKTLWYYDGAQFPLYQCVYPDKSNRFPWERGFEPRWWGIQPHLWLDDLDAAAPGDHWRLWMEQSNT